MNAPVKMGPEVIRAIWVGGPEERRYRDLEDTLKDRLKVDLVAHWDHGQLPRVMPADIDIVFICDRFLTPANGRAAKEFAGRHGVPVNLVEPSMQAVSNAIHARGIKYRARPLPVKEPEPPKLIASQMAALGSMPGGTVSGLPSQQAPMATGGATVIVPPKKLAHQRETQGGRTLTADGLKLRISLLTLLKAGPATTLDLAATTGEGRSTVGYVLNSLRRLGYVKRTGETDARRSAVWQMVKAELPSAELLTKQQNEYWAKAVAKGHERRRRRKAKEGAGSKAPDDRMAHQAVRLVSWQDPCWQVMRTMVQDAGYGAILL